MIELIFGTILSIFFIGLSFLLNKGDSSSTVNNTLFYWIFSLFLLLGLFLIAKGLLKIIRNFRTSIYGKEYYGIIVNIFPNGVKVNGHPELDAEVLISIDNRKILRLRDTIGFDWNKYTLQDYVKVKYYKNDINILHKVEDYTLPPETKDYLQQSLSLYPDIRRFYEDPLRTNTPLKITRQIRF